MRKEVWGRGSRVRQLFPSQRRVGREISRRIILPFFKSEQKATGEDVVRVREGYRSQRNRVGWGLAVL